MGIGKIAEARETAGGTVQAGGPSAKAVSGTGGFDPLRANIDPFKARKIQIESLRPVAEAMRRHELATKGIEAASATRADIDEIRNGLPEGEHAGMWKDDTGVWRPALNNEEMIRRKFETENTMGVSFEEYRKGIFDLAKNAIKRRKDQRLAGETNDVRAFVNRETGEDIVAFEGDCEEALLVGRIGENFARANAAVAGDAGAMNSTALGRIGANNAQLKTLKAIGGDEFDAGAAARQRTDLWARQYVRQSLEGRAKAAVVLASQSGGLMSPAAAMKRANEIYDGQARDLMRRLVEAGEYDRARTFAGYAKDLGYSDAAKSKAFAEIGAAEIGAAVNEANVAISAIRDAEGNYPAGRVETIERSIATLQRVGAAQKKDSKLAANAAEAVSQLDRHADTIRFGEMIDGFDQSQIGRLDLVKAKNPYKKGTRDARCWEMARKAMMNRTASSPERKAFIDAMKTNGRKYATTSPAKFYEDLNDAVASGIITKGDKDGLVDDFESKFAKGFPGAGDEAPVLQQRFAAIASIFKEEFGNDIEAEVARDKDGFVKFNRTGAIAYDKKATPTELTIKEEHVVPARMVGTGMPGEAVYAPEMRSTVTHTLTPEEKLDLSNAALRLARFDGMELGFDPVTGIEMDVGKTYKVNLVADLKRMCRTVKSRKESERVRDQVFANLRGKRAMEGIVDRVTDPFGMATTSFGGMVDDYAAGMEADRTEAERRAPEGNPKTAIDAFIKRIGEHGKKLRD